MVTLPAYPHMANTTSNPDITWRGGALRGWFEFRRGTVNNHAKYIISQFGPPILRWGISESVYLRSQIRQVIINNTCYTTHRLRALCGGKFQISAPLTGETTLCFVDTICTRLTRLLDFRWFLTEYSGNVHFFVAWELLALFVTIFLLRKCAGWQKNVIFSLILVSDNSGLFTLVT